MRRGTLCLPSLVVVLFLVSIAVPSPATAQPAPSSQQYRPPVDAPVTDPFRPPPQPWAPGNRGIEYGTRAGTPVRAIGPGVVAFAGPVAGRLHVTVRHPDGLRSSYSFVAAVRVRVGQEVDGGEVVAVAADRLHLGVRDGDTYLDPASLWGTAVDDGPVVLVPLEGRSLHFPTGLPPGGPRSTSSVRGRPRSSFAARCGGAMAPGLAKPLGRGRRSCPSPSSP